MTPELVEHINTNEVLFKTWIDDGARLQIGMAVLEPIIPVFLEEFPTVNLNGNCHECILDMLIWARAEAKKGTEPKAKKK
jgi:hypothetical protein